MCSKSHYETYQLDRYCFDLRCNWALIIFFQRRKKLFQEISVTYLLLEMPRFCVETTSHFENGGAESKYRIRVSL